MMEFPKTPTGDVLELLVASTREKMNAHPELVVVFDDLVRFTGLTEDEVLLRIVKKSRGVWGAKGWFYEEWDFHAPVSSAEVEWFYRTAQSYLFSNARHPSWDQLHKVESGPVLDFGGGAAMNTMELLRRGFDVVYFDLGVMQTEFVKYRVQQHHYEHECSFVKGVEICAMSDESVATVIAQDVLEHLPDYRPTLRNLIRVLKFGGCILERSPFRPTGHKRGIPMHMEAPAPLKRVMKNNGMALEWSGPDNAHIWRKTER